MVFREFIKAFFWTVISLAVLLILVFLLACGHKSRIKLYKIDSTRERLLRSLSDKDVLSFEDSHGYFCVSPRDLERLAEEVISRNNQCETKD